MIRQLATIAGTTFTEAIRQPVYLLLLGVGAILLALGPSASGYTMQHEMDNVMLAEMGLSTLGGVGVLLACFIASSVLSKEIDQRTVLTVVSKPVPRPVFVLGKYLGVVAAVTLVFLTLSIVFMLSLRHQVMSTASDRFDKPVLLAGAGLGLLIPVLLAAGANYYFRRPFISTLVACIAAGQVLALLLVLVVAPDVSLQSPLHEFQVNDHEKLKIATGILVVLMGVLMMAALALACSTRVGVVPTLAICLGVGLFGITSSALNQWVNQRLEIPAAVSVLDSFSYIASSSEPAGLKAAFYASKTGYLVFPNLQVLWPSDAITLGKQIPLVHLGTLAAYAGLYITAFLGFAVVLFQRREVG